MRKLKISCLLLLISQYGFAIDPTPGSGTYDPGIATCTGERTGQSVNKSVLEYFSKSHEKKISDYITDSCDQSYNYEYSYGTCSDGSVSFYQPGSEGVFEQEGMCGQVGISNLYNNYCQWNLSVEDVDTYYANDMTPGTRTGVLVNGLNRLFRNNSDCPKGEFEDFYAKDERDYISSILSATHQTVGGNQLIRRDHRGRLVKRAPVMALIAVPGKKVLHWVMVVDVEFHHGQCKFIVNTWDDQMTVPCSDMARWSRDVDRKFPGVPGISKYTIIQFNKN